jgi:hypothetical protein
MLPVSRHDPHLWRVRGGTERAGRLHATLRPGQCFQSPATQPSLHTVFTFYTNQPIFCSPPPFFKFFFHLTVCLGKCSLILQGKPPCHVEWLWHSFIGCSADTLADGPGVLQYTQRCTRPRTQPSIWVLEVSAGGRGFNEITSSSTEALRPVPHQQA